MVSIRGRKNRTWQLLLVIVLTPILAGVVWGGLNSFLDQGDRIKVERMNSALNVLHNNLSSEGSSRGDLFIYRKGCNEITNGWMPTGEYTCFVESSTDKLVLSPDEAVNMHENYFEIVDKYEGLTKKGGIKNYPRGLFGVEKIVSFIEQGYALNNTSAPCMYVARMMQGLDYKGSLQNEAGSKITSTNARVVVTVSCSMSARGDWL